MNGLEVLLAIIGIVTMSAYLLWELFDYDE